MKLKALQIVYGLASILHGIVYIFTLGNVFTSYPLAIMNKIAYIRWTQKGYTLKK